MSLLLTELAATLRHLRRAPRFPAFALGLLAAGLGATVGMYSIFHSIVLRPLPLAAPEQLVGIQALNPPKAIVQDGVSVADFRDFARRSRSFSAVGALRPNFASFTRPGEAPIRLVTGLVTRDLLTTLGVPPSRGRIFAPGEFSLAAPRTVLLSHAAWQRYFGGGNEVLGRTIVLDDEPCTVIGIMPETFREPAFVDAWLPFPEESPEYYARESRFWTMVGRLAPGISAAEASAELATIASGLARDYSETNRDWSVAAVPLQDLRIRGLRGALLLLVGAVGLVLVIACLNLANLLLARVLAQLPELGVRLALGATPNRLALRVLLESLIIASGGALLGSALAAAGLAVARNLIPTELLPRAHEVALHAPGLAAAATLAILCGTLCALLPALRLRRLDVNVLLKHTSTRGAMGGGTGRWQAVLVAGQVALTVTVLTAGLLMMRSLVRLQNVSPGFDPRGIITVPLSPPPSRYETPDELARYYDDLIAAVAAVPGVTGAGVNASLPLSGITLGFPAWTDGSGRDAASAHAAVYAPVSEGYFELMRQSLQQGRTFNAHDGSRGAPVAVVNEAFVRTAFPDGRALGRSVFLLPWMGDTYREIVGVVADTRQDNLTAPPPAQIYVPQRQMPWLFSTLLVRLERPGLAPAVQAALHAADPTLPFAPSSMVDAIAQTATQPRLYTLLFSLFAAVALGLSALGIYASLRFILHQRVREIGVRLALGATPASIVRWILGQVGRLVAAGFAFGLLGALALAAALRAQLFGVTMMDPITFASLPLLIGFASLCAALPTALRAARLPPSLALQAD